MRPAVRLYTWPAFGLPGRKRCFSATPFGIKVQRVLHYKKVPFSVEEVGWLEAATRLPALSTSGKLPVLEYDGERIEDSTRIAYLLEERHPEPRLVPREPTERARMHFMEEWADEVLYRYRQYGEIHFSDSALTAQAYYADIPEETRTRMVEKRRAGMEAALHQQGFGRYPESKFWAEFRRSLDGLAALIEGDGFLAGFEVSLADIAVFAQIHRAVAGADPWYEAEVRERAVLDRWMERIDAITSATPTPAARRGAGGGP